MVLALGLALASPVLKLVDPGAAPRSVLTISPSPGTRERVRLEMALSARVTNDGVPLPPAELPTMVLQVSSEVLSTGPIRYRVRVESATVEEGAAADITEALREPLARLAGLAGVVEMDAQGWPTKTTWETPEGVDPALLEELQRSLDTTRPRLPREPVGDGASWTLTETRADDGFEVTQTDTVALDLDGSRWVLLTSVMQTAPTPQTVGDAVLEKHVGSGQGKLVLDPGHVLPTEEVLGLSTRTRMKLSEQVGSVTQTGLELSIHRVP